MDDSRRRVSYALIGAGLAQGAAAGLLLVRLLAGRSFSLRRAAREIAQDLATYLYVVGSTTVVFAVFGRVLGRYADELAKLATADHLTGLLNVRAFHDRFREEMTRAVRYGQPLSVLILDLDGLKAVNDVYGHQAGDDVLRRVAAAIRHGLRGPDAGARIGGDEFAVLAPNTDQAAAMALGERLRSLVVDAQAGAVPPPATVSIGIASVVPSARETATELALTRDADLALYRAKRQGGNRVIASAARQRTSVRDSTATG